MKKLKKIIVLMLAIFMAMPTAGLLISAQEVEDLTVQRLGGKDRYATAVTVSESAYPYGSQNVVIVGHNGEADAISGTLLAASLNAPLLYTKQNILSATTLNEVIRLKADNIFILGGEKVVSNEVESALENLATVKRIAGKDRFETAAQIAKLVAKTNEPSHAFIVLGRSANNDSLADALAIGPVSARDNSPILLVEKNFIPQVTIDTLNLLNIKNVTIIGGNEAVSQNVETQLNLATITFDRIAGDNRNETAIKIATRYFPYAKTAIIANGNKSADALVGGYFGKLINAPIIFTYNHKETLPTSSEQYLTQYITKSFVIGGSKVVSTLTRSYISKAQKVEQVSPILVNAVNIIGEASVATISLDSQTLQMLANVQPAYATNKKVTWSIINKTGLATISSTGLITPLKNGSITILATADDGSNVVGTLDVTISGQITQDYLDIQAAKIAIENAVYISTQAKASDTSNALTKAQTLVNNLGLALKGTTVTVTTEQFTAANAGVDGTYTFKVAINKGIENQVVTSIQSMTISATKTLVGFNFENVTKRNAGFANYTADVGIVGNKDVATIGISNANFTVFVKGSLPGEAPNANNWTYPSEAYWYVKFSTKDYKDIKLSSKQQGSETGPKNFKVQWSLDGFNWSDIAGGNIIVTGNFTEAGAGSLNNLVLPSAIENEETVYLRWINSSAVSIKNEVVSSTGTNRIDDIIITGAYDPTLYDATQDNLDIAAAKTAIEDATYKAVEVEVSSESAAKSKAQTLVDNLGSTLKATTVTVITEQFIAANAGVDGTYTFRVKIDKGQGTQITSVEKTMIISATRTLVGLNFENVTKRNAGFANYTADVGIVGNKDVATIGIKNAAFTEFVVGYSPGEAPNANNWTYPAESYWHVKFSTKDYNNLVLSSKQQGSPSGPKNFKVQWSLDGISWLDVAGGDITVTNNFTDTGSGSLNNLVLPAAIDNKPTVYLRWIVSSKKKVNGTGDFIIGGTNRIDDIIISGTYDPT